jgi:hypothetical protein
VCQVGLLQDGLDAAYLLVDLYKKSIFDIV